MWVANNKTGGKYIDLGPAKGRKHLTDDEQFDIIITEPNIDDLLKIERQEGTTNGNDQDSA